jgi:hypothetical protein
MDGQDGSLAAAQSNTLQPNSASCAFAEVPVLTARMALKVRERMNLRMLTSTATVCLEHDRGVISVIIMTGIINGQCAVKQPQNCVIPPEFVGTGKNAEVYILFFNNLATAPQDAGPSNSIDSWEDLGQYEQGATRDLGSRT